MFRNNDISDGGRPVLIGAPVDPVLTLERVKQHLRVDYVDENLLIQGMIDAAVGMLDPAAAGTLGRALRPQTWELQLRSFNDRRPTPRRHLNHLAIPLPYPPLISIVSVKYLDVTGADQTLSLGTDYRVLNSGAVYSRQAVAPPFGQSWPIARIDDASVRIRFTCGYPAPNADAEPPVPETLPAPIMAWLKLVIGSLYENRESIAVGAREAVALLPDHILGMIESYRLD